MYNYRKYVSIVLVAIANINYNFIAVNVGAYRSSADLPILKFCNEKEGNRQKISIPSARNEEKNYDSCPYIIALIFIPI